MITPQKHGGKLQSCRELLNSDPVVTFMRFVSDLHIPQFRHLVKFADKLPLLSRTVCTLLKGKKRRMFIAVVLAALERLQQSV